MNTRHLALPMLTLLTVTLLTSIGDAKAAGPFRQAYGQVQSRGLATIVDRPGGPLTVSNIGSSGRDGVAFEVGKTRGAIGPIKWMAPESLAGRSYSIVVTGEDAAGDHSNFACVATNNASGMWELGFDPLTSRNSGFTWQLRGNGNPLFTGTGHNGEMLLFESSNPPIGATATGVWGDNNGDYESDHFTLSYPAGTSVVYLQEIYIIDEVSIQFDTFSTEMVALNLMEVLGTEPSGGVGELIVINRPGGMFGQVVGSLGGSEIMGIGSSGLDGVDRLRVSNIGSSGLDGVAMETDGTSTTQAFVLEFPQPPVASKKLFVGGLSWNTDDGTGTQPPVVQCEFATDSFLDIWTDLTVNDPPSRIEFLLGEEVVGIAPFPASGVRLVTGVQPPYKLGYSSTPDGGINVEIGFLEPVTFDNGGIDDDCDGVRLIHSPNPVSAFYPVHEIFVRGADIPGAEMIVTGCPNVLPPDPISPWTSAIALGAANVVVTSPGGLKVDNIGSSGQDGVRLSFPPAGDQAVTFSTRSRRPPYDAHKTILKAFGSNGGKASHGDLLAQLTCLGTAANQIEYAADLSPVGPGPLTWNFYDDGVLVGSAVRASSATCFGSDAIPSAFTAAVAHPDGKPRLIIDLPDDSPVVLLGGTKAEPAMNKADLIEVVLGGAIVTSFTNVTDIEMRGAVHGADFLAWSGYSGVSAVPGLTGSIALRLRPAAPNPFNPRTVIAFDLAREAYIELRVFDLRGHLVRNLYRGRKPAGSFRETWDGLNDQGRGQASGTYLFQLKAGGEVQTQKAVLVR